MSLFRKIKEQSREYYRFVIMDDATFEEKFVFKLTPLSVFVTVVTSVILLIILSISLVAFTPLREYIPGYGSRKQEKKIASLQTTVDSLFIAMSEIENYRQDVRNVLLGKDFKEDTLSASDMGKKEAKFTMTSYDSLLMLIQEESLLPKEASQSYLHNPQYNEQAQTLFFSPVSGVLQQKQMNQGIVIACKKGTSIYASAAGTVVYAGYDLQKGTNLIIHHPNNVLMIYQQIGTALVCVGDVVKAKQVIAVTDFDQMVYFELWMNGTAVPPENFILF
jgi:murein DD-endopeptidase MepM/ murein hydrolase activator NlpD